MNRRVNDGSVERNWDDKQVYRLKSNKMLALRVSARPGCELSCQQGGDANYGKEKKKSVRTHRQSSTSLGNLDHPPQVSNSHLAYAMEPSSYKDSTPTSFLSPLRTSQATPKKPRRIGLILRRLSTEWSSFVSKVKALSEAAFSEDEAVCELFELSEEDTFERILRATAARFSPTEHQFLVDFKEYKSLDKLYEAKRKPPMTQLASLDDLESNTASYRELDIVKLRDDLETRVKTTTVMSDASTDSSRRGSSHEPLSKQNIGEKLWEYRRAKWLTPKDEVDIAERINELTVALPIKLISKDLYPRVYKNLVEKSKPLKAGKRINLEDLINIINAGWVSEEKWDRAAKGLA